MSLVERIPDQPAVPWRPFGPLTRDDLDRLPNDGHRYELVDGALLVTPAPVPRHQVVCAAIYRALFAACPPHLQVLFAPLDVVLTADTVMQPACWVLRGMPSVSVISKARRYWPSRCCRPARGGSISRSSSRGTRPRAARRTGWWIPTRRV